MKRKLQRGVDSWHYPVQIQGVHTPEFNIKSTLRCANDVNMKCLFSCIFFQVIHECENSVLYLSTAKEIQDRCCYSEDTSWFIDGFGISLVSESINSTSCKQTNVYVQLLRVLQEFTFSLKIISTFHVMAAKQIAAF